MEQEHKSNFALFLDKDHDLDLDLDHDHEKKDDNLDSTSSKGHFNKPVARQTAIVKQFSNVKPITVSDPCPREYLQMVHSKEYLDFLEHAYQDAEKHADNDWFDTKEKCLIPAHFPSTFARARFEQNSKISPLYKHSAFYGMDYMTPIFKTTFEHASTSAHSSILAAQHMIKHQCLTYSVNRSPGHHAFSNQYAGYCFLNNGALAAQMIRLKTQKRVGILDLDYHAGQASQTIFWQDPNVVTVSLHADPTIDYPSDIGFASETGDEKLAPMSNLNFCMPKGTTWKTYLKNLKVAIDFLTRSKIEYLVLAFGADTFEKDPDPSNVAGFSIKLEDYTEMGAFIGKSFNPSYMTIVQEGGYNLDHVGEISWRLVNGILNS